MTINTWLNSTTNVMPEIDILQDITDENIRACGNDVVYILRDRINEDYLFGETPISEFKEGVTFEMYQERIEQFNGDGDLLSKFGIDHTDSSTWVVSVRRAKEELTAFGFTKPRPGDLIYHPTYDALWEIKYTKNDKDFYQFGRNYSYRLECSLFQYSHESIDVDGVPDINAQFTFDTSDIGDPAEDDVMRSTLGIHPSKRSENSDDLVREAGSIIAFDPNNPFST